MLFPLDITQKVLYTKGMMTKAMTLDWNGRCLVRSDGKRFYWRRDRGIVQKMQNGNFVEIGKAVSFPEAKEIALAYRNQEIA